MKTLQERLIYARSTAGLTQAEVARRAGCSQSAIGNVESGTRLHLKNIFAVAAALDCNPEWLQDGKGAFKKSALLFVANEVREPTRAQYAADWPFTASKQRYMALPSQMRAKADAYILGLVDAFEGGLSNLTKKAS